jgi:hypothetical protein
MLFPLNGFMKMQQETIDFDQVFGLKIDDVINEIATTGSSVRFSRQCLTLDW